MEPISKDDEGVVRKLKVSQRATAFCGKLGNRARFVVLRRKRTWRRFHNSSTALPLVSRVTIADNSTAPVPISGTVPEPRRSL